MTIDYRTVQLEQLSIRDLTDAYGLPQCAELFNTSRRAIYTLRSTNSMHVVRRLKLVEAIRADEARCRDRLLLVRLGERERAAADAAADAAA